MTAEFYIGMMIASLFIVLGVVLGYRFGRRAEAEPLAQSRAEVEPLLANLRRFTNHFSRDVSAYRSVIHTASEQARALATQPRGGLTSSSDSEHILAQILEANELLQSRLNEAESNLMVQTEKLQAYMTEARTDLLTGISNRRAFDEELLKRIALFQRQQVPVGVVLLDVDHFKGVNDRHGHAMGDLVLKRVAEALDRSARDTDVVARYGGEEFVIAMVGSSAEEFGKAADRLRRAVQAIEVRGEQTVIRPTVSCGVAPLMPGEKASDLLRRADDALYTAKREGRNCSFFHDGQRTYRIQIASNVALNSKEAVVSHSEHFLQLCQDLRTKLMQLRGPAGL